MKTSHENPTFRISSHADKRLRKRTGWPRKSAMRMVERALKVGTSLDSAKNREQVLFLCGKTDPGEETSIRVHGQFVFIFAKQYDDTESYELILVTVHHLPSEFRSAGTWLNSKQPKYLLPLAG